MSQDLLRVCSRMVSLGEKLGADEIEVFAGAQSSLESGIENTELKLAKKSSGSSIGIRVFRKHSLGFSSVNSLDWDKLEKAVRNAIALSKNSPSDVHNGLPTSRKHQKISSLDDKNVAEMNEEEIIEKVKIMLVSARSVDDRISIDSGRFEAIHGEKAISNSFGVEGVEDFTGIFYDIGIHAVEGSNVSSVDYRMDGSRSLKGDTSEKVSRKLAESVIESLHAKKMESCIGTIVISPLAALEILVSPIFFSVDSDNVQKGVSRFAQKREESVAAPLLTIIDDGTIPGGLSSSAFDREGVPHSKLSIIEKGKLKAFLYDQYTANKEHIASTGHASGGPRSAPSIDATNIQVSPGNETVDQLISSVKKGLYVQRFSGRVDSVSGDFSGIAKMSKKIDSGALNGVVRETMISGNVFDVLMNLQSASKETEKILDFILPHFAVADINITSE